MFVLRASGERQPVDGNTDVLIPSDVRRHVVRAIATGYLNGNSTVRHQLGVHGVQERERERYGAWQRLIVSNIARFRDAVIAAVPSSIHLSENRIQVPSRQM